MNRRCITAFTSSAPSYPGYVSVNEVWFGQDAGGEDQTAIAIAVRSDPRIGAERVDCGLTSTVILTLEEWDDLVDRINGK